jgi:altronate dehydratase large subunit
MEFLGYTRPDGSAGIRNYVLVIPPVRCSNELAWTIAEGVSGAVPLLHNHSCARIGPDVERARRTLAGLGRNPNVAGVVVAAIGCENILPEDLAADIAESGKPVEVVSIEKEGTFQAAVDKGQAAARSMVARACRMVREPQPLSRLRVGVKCGGSATISSLAGHPATGFVLDEVIKAGGTALFTETAEVIGAEHIMAGRAATPAVAERLLEVVGRFEKMIADSGLDIRGSQPSPGNIKSGLSTLEEKSLGAMHKTGHMPLAGVLEYAQKPDAPGLYLMDSTAWTPQLMLGMAAAGCNVFIFSVGGGLPARSRSQPGMGRVPIVPVVKITGDPGVKDELEYFDVYAGTVIEGTEEVEDVGRRLLTEILDVASGKPTKQEHSRYYEVLDMYLTGPQM